jgi:hypothetical protein
VNFVWIAHITKLNGETKTIDRPAMLPDNRYVGFNSMCSIESGYPYSQGRIEGYLVLRQSISGGEAYVISISNTDKGFPDLFLGHGRSQLFSPRLQLFV